MIAKPSLKRNDLIEPDLSYEIVGAIFEVYNELGHGLKEITYQRAVASSLKKRGLIFQEQLMCPIKFNGEKVGTRFLDFLVANKIIVELKCGDHLARSHIAQVHEYLKLTNLNLAILATITSTGVRFRRIINLSDFVRFV